MCQARVAHRYSTLGQNNVDTLVAQWEKDPPRDAFFYINLSKNYLNIQLYFSVYMSTCSLASFRSIIDNIFQLHSSKQFLRHVIPHVESFKFSTWRR